MIKINSVIQSHSNFETSEAVLVINSYNINQTVVLTTGSTMPAMANSGKSVNVNYQLYKSLEDYENKAQPFSSKANWFFNFNNITGNTINAYSLVSDKLLGDGIDNEIL